MPDRPRAIGPIRIKGESQNGKGVKRLLTHQAVETAKHQIEDFETRIDANWSEIHRREARLARGCRLGNFRGQPLSSEDRARISRRIAGAQFQAWIATGGPDDPRDQSAITFG